MQRTITLVLSLIVSFAAALELPSLHVEAHKAAPKSAHWWTQVGDRVFYAPPASFLGLSQNVSDYYYVMGSKSALTDTMKDKVVGSQGRWHIMHLPKGPAMLQLSAQSCSGDRRSSLSRFTRLESGTVLSAGFPAYALGADYKHPLDEAGQQLEKDVVGAVTEESAMGYLQKITEFPTRSYSDSDASDKVEKYLKDQFEALGMHTCFHTFDSGRAKLTNIVAHIPGSESVGSVTVGAHYDSRPFEGKAPGAEDNGSGLASLLALAHAFKKHKVTPKRSVYFVAFAGEEPGLLGSREFAKALQSQALPSECTANGASAMLQLQKKGQKRKTKNADPEHLAIVMDEIGWLSPKLSKPTVNLESYDTLGNKVMQHLRASTDMHNGDSLDVVHNGSPFGSDHMSFLDLQMQAALTINGDDEAYPNYHQSTDTIDNVDGAYMAKIAKMNMGGLMRLCMA